MLKGWKNGCLAQLNYCRRHKSFDITDFFTNQLMIFTNFTKKCAKSSIEMYHSTYQLEEVNPSESVFFNSIF
jgi:hypothetical protein